MIELVFDTLYRIGPTASVQPHLAAGAAGRRREAHDACGSRCARACGSTTARALTAADVVASLERVRTSPARWMLAPVAVDARRRRRGRARAARADRGPRAVPRAAADGDHQERPGRPAERPIGSGPFAVDSSMLRSAGSSLRRVRRSLRRPPVPRSSSRCAGTTRPTARRDGSRPARRSSRRAASPRSSAPSRSIAPATSRGRPRCSCSSASGARTPRCSRPHRSATRSTSRSRAARLTSIGSGERVAPDADPVPVEAGGAALSTAGRLGDLDGARAALAQAARTAKTSPEREGTAEARDPRRGDAPRRPRDRRARRVSRSTKLGIAVDDHRGPGDEAPRARRARARCDLWIGQLAAPVTAAPLWWGAAFAAGGDRGSSSTLAAGALDLSAAAKTFGERVPIVPLLFRSVRIWHRTDIRGLGFDASGRPELRGRVPVR